MLGNNFWPISIGQDFKLDSYSQVMCVSFILSTGSNSLKSTSFSEQNHLLLIILTRGNYHMSYEPTHFLLDYGKKTTRIQLYLLNSLNGLDNSMRNVFQYHRTSYPCCRIIAFHLIDMFEPA